MTELFIGSLTVADAERIRELLEIQNLPRTTATVEDRAEWNSPLRSVLHTPDGEGDFV